MTQAQRQDLLREIQAMPEKTELERWRKFNAMRHFNSNNDGAMGIIKEILDKSPRSKSTNFSKQGDADCYVYVDGSRFTVERKTNGGRIGSLLEKNAPKYVAYSMDVCNAGTSYKRRKTETKIFKTSTFLQILDECGAIKSTNGKNPELAIQVTSKTLFIAIEEYGLTYDCTRKYTAEDFED